MKKRIIIKTVIFIITSILLTGLGNTISPMMSSSLAILQMYNTQDSSFWIQMYSYLTNYTYFLYIAFAILLYNKDIVTLINFIKEKMKHDKTS